MRFKNEFRALADLHHANLVSLGELIHHDGLWFFTMELVDGGDLLSHVRAARQARRRAAARRRFMQLAEGLVALHAAGKVHRDIKPSNVRVTHQGRVVLLDLGLVTDAHRAGRGAHLERSGGRHGDLHGARAGAVEAGDRGGRLVLRRRRALRGADRRGAVRRLAARRAHAQAVGAAAAAAPARARRAARARGAVPAASSPSIRPSGRDAGRGARRRSAPGGDACSGGARGAGTSPPMAPAPPFVGRAAELATLEDAFTATRDGGSVAVVVRGESGVGKSSLVRRFAERRRGARRGGARGPLLRARERALQGARRRHRRARELHGAHRSRRGGGALAGADGAARHGVPGAPARRGGGARAQARERAARPVAAAHARVRGGARAVGAPGRSAAARRRHRRSAVGRRRLAGAARRDHASARRAGALVRRHRPHRRRARSRRARRASSAPTCAPLAVGGLVPAEARELAQLLAADAGTPLAADAAAAIGSEAAGHPLFIDEMVRHALAQTAERQAPQARRRAVGAPRAAARRRAAHRGAGGQGGRALVARDRRARRRPRGAVAAVASTCRRCARSAWCARRARSGATPSSRTTIACARR